MVVIHDISSSYDRLCPYPPVIIILFGIMDMSSNNNLGWKKFWYANAPADEANIEQLQFGVTGFQLFAGFFTGAVCYRRSFAS